MILYEVLFMICLQTIPRTLIYKTLQMLNYQPSENIMPLGQLILWLISIKRGKGLFFTSNDKDQGSSVDELLYPNLVAYPERHHPNPIVMTSCHHPKRRNESRHLVPNQRTASGYRVHKPHFGFEQPVQRPRSETGHLVPNGLQAEETLREETIPT